VTAQPDCFDCERNGLGHPCRRDGLFDVATFAAAYVAQSPEVEADDGTSNEDLHWTFTCGHSLAQDWPDVCLDVVIACLLRISTPHQADYLAAGNLEDVIRKHGDTIIERIELLARRSPRFRYLLTGVWPQGQQDGAIWARIVAARGNGRHIGDGGPIPPIDDWIALEA